MSTASPERESRTATGHSAELEARLRRLLDESQITANRDLILDLARTTIGLGTGVTNRLDLKIAAAALREMEEAFSMFAPFHGLQKVTIFGSARTEPSDPAYDQARRLARQLADLGWMVVTGAGPGIMAAGVEGAGTELALGVNIRLPFEQSPHPLLAADGGRRLVEMRYFFTRKLMLVKESSAFVALPGGFGTLDETFELLTLAQTGRAEPAPIVLLDSHGGTYWSSWAHFVETEVVRAGLANTTDRSFYRITDSVEEAVDELRRFYANYHSRRFVGRVLVLRLLHEPTDDQIAELNACFADCCDERGIWRSPPLPEERGDADHLDLYRLAFVFDQVSTGRLRSLIDAVNAWAPLPAG